ncbi:RNA-binding protein lark [Engraulis encrasicolus]|uniref:RNA-binding protein lark n=1 Tax=Engraulis encrasicolus TaxID=184585 RepID=UPI002FD677F1
MVKVFVGNLNTSTKEEELREVFEKYGTVVDCDIISNYGFVHMSEEEEAKKAVAELNKHRLNGFNMTVQFATTRVRNATKIHVGNIPEGVTALRVRELFQEYGKVLECDVLKKYAFVHMQRHKDAMEAIHKLNHSKLEGQTLFVSLSHTNPGKQAPPPHEPYPPGPPHHHHHYPPHPYPPAAYPPLRSRPLGRLPPPPPPPSRLRPLPPPPPPPMRLRPPRYDYDHDPYDIPPPPPPSLHDRNGLDRPLRRPPLCAYEAPLERRALPPPPAHLYRERSPLRSLPGPPTRRPVPPPLAPLARSGPPYQRYATTARFDQDEYYY